MMVFSSRQHQGATWPFVCVLAVLFALCVTAPRAWQRKQVEHAGIDLAIRHQNPTSLKKGGQPRATVHRVVTTVGEPTLTPPPDLQSTDDTAPLPPVVDARADEPSEIFASEVFPPLVPSTAVRPSRVPDAPELTLPELSDPPPPIGSDTATWPEPVALLNRLQPLSCECECCEWALNVDRLIRKLIDDPRLGATERLELLDDLQKANAEVDSLAAETGASRLTTQLRQAQHALSRRLGIWRPLAAMQSAEPSSPSPRPRRELALAIADVSSLLDDNHSEAQHWHSEAQRWREYICLDAVRELAAQRASADDTSARELARKVVARLNRRGLSRRQREWIDAGPLANLEMQLHYWSAQPVDPHQVLADLETFEESTLPGDAESVAAAVKHLSWSADPQHQALGRWINRHYRNANFRFSASGEFLSRLMPDVRPTQQRVDDTILGVPVDGRSETTTQLSIRPVPAEGRLLVELVADGTISSRTQSDSGLAILHNRGQATYSARKKLTLGLDGVTARPATVDVQSRTRLRSVNTDFDTVPVIGYLFQEVARSEYSQNLGRVRREQERKIDARVRAEVDRLAQQRLKTANRRYHQRVTVPLERLSVSPLMIEANSTDKRIIARVRLAAEAQLGSHTPRPVAPSDSLMSVQVHQSALNNLLAGLELEGGTFSLEELNRRVSQRLNRPAEEEEETTRDDVTIRFAERDALRARFADDRIELTVAVAKLTTSRRTWSNFAVRVFYRPSSTALGAELTRDGSIQLIGPTVRGPQIALRGIFTRTFSSKNTWPLFPEAVSDNPRLARVAITQCVIDNGWFGLAVGPHHENVARRTDAVIRSRR